MAQDANMDCGLLRNDGFLLPSVFFSCAYSATLHPLGCRRYTPTLSRLSLGSVAKSERFFVFTLVLSNPYPCISKHSHPWAVFAPFIGVPGVSDGAYNPFGVWHHNGETSIAVA